MSLLVKTQSCLIQERPVLEYAFPYQSVLLTNSLIVLATLGVWAFFAFPFLLVAVCAIMISALSTLLLHERSVAKQMAKLKNEEKIISHKMNEGIQQCLADILPKALQTSAHEKWTFVFQVSIDKNGPRNGVVLCKTSSKDISALANQIFSSIFRNILEKHPLHSTYITYIAELPLDTMSNHERLNYIKKLQPH